jgi:U3 small nucleolar RNA-associated protein 18
MYDSSSYSTSPPSLLNSAGPPSLENPTFTSSLVDQPEPLKTLSALTTRISTLAFNHDAQLLVMASREGKDGMRVVSFLLPSRITMSFLFSRLTPSHQVHTNSLTTFSNFPTSSTPLGHVSSAAFSARSEYLAVGNTRGKVLLWSLKDYGSSLAS